MANKEEKTYLFSAPLGASNIAGDLFLRPSFCLFSSLPPFRASLRPQLRLLIMVVSCYEKFFKIRKNLDKMVFF